MLVDLAYVFFFFAIIEEHSISLLYKFCTNRCLLTVIQLFFPDHKNLKLEFQSFFFFLKSTSLHFLDKAMLQHVQIPHGKSGCIDL